MNKDEWQARVDLAACYHLCALQGWDDVIYTHISAAVPGEAGHYLINPFGLRFDEVCASNLVKVDRDGNPVDAAQYDINARASCCMRRYTARATISAASCICIM
jgi:ribulose-5-phosphate 4-epimerase/fuculose-1-phosphate aldolase